jgi:hypothetical protein
MPHLLLELLLIDETFLASQRSVQVPQSSVVFGYSTLLQMIKKLFPSDRAGALVLALLVNHLLQIFSIKHFRELDLSRRLLQTGNLEQMKNCKAHWDQ